MGTISFMIHKIDVPGVKTIAKLEEEEGTVSLSVSSLSAESP